MVAWALWRRAPAARVVEVAIGAFVLLTPALHPWYVLWLLPLVAVGGSWAWMVLAVLAPLGYRPLDGVARRRSAGAIRLGRVCSSTALDAGRALAIDRWQPSGIIVKFGESQPRESGWAQGG